MLVENQPVARPSILVFRPGADDRLHQRLPGLEVLAGDRHALTFGEGDDAGKVDRQVGGAVGERNPAHDRCVGVNLARRDVVVAIAQALLEGLDRQVHVGRFLERLGRRTPDHHEPVAVVLGAEALDVGHERLGLLELVRLGLDPHALDARHPALVEDGVHGHDTLELLGQWRQVELGHHARGARRLVHVRREGIPAAEDQVVEVGERYELTNAGVAAVLPLAEPDVGHLTDRAHRCIAGVPGVHDAGDEGRGDGAHAGHEHAETAGSGSDGARVRHGSNDKQSFAFLSVG